MSMRSRGAMRDQTPERKALRAALTAASTSLPLLRATSQMTELSTGLIDSKVRPFLASTNLPSMKLRFSGFSLLATLCQPLRSKDLACSRFMVSSSILAKADARPTRRRGRRCVSIFVHSIPPRPAARLALGPAQALAVDDIESAGSDDRAPGQGPAVGEIAEQGQPDRCRPNEL